MKRVSLLVLIITGSLGYDVFGDVRHSENANAGGKTSAYVNYWTRYDSEIAGDWYYTQQEYAATIGVMIDWKAGNTTGCFRKSAVLETVAGDLKIPQRVGNEDQFDVITIANSAFSQCNSLTSITIPFGVREIGDGAFWGCSALLMISIPSSVRTIGDMAFIYCSTLKEIRTEPGDSDRVKEMVRMSGFDVAKITFSETLPLAGSKTNPWLIGRDVATDVKAWVDDLGNLTIKGAGAVRDFNPQAAPWLCRDVVTVKIGDGIVSIGANAFCGLLNVQSIVVPTSVKTIAATAFSGSGLKEIFFEGIPPAMSSLELPAGVRVRYNANEDFSKIILAQMGLDYMTPYVPEGTAKPDAVGSQSNVVCVVVSNVVTHYVLNSIQAEIAAPASYDTGFVNIIAEVKGGCVAVPATWTVKYSKFTEKFGSDFTKALAMQTGKKDGAGNPMFVWQDYVAGTDPTDETDVFTASITIVDGKVTVSYSPELDDARKALRKYTTWGKAKLTDKDWSVVGEGEEGNFNFFKVTVEMK